jgi:hypothetical protein
MAAIGTCEADSTVGGNAPNVIALVLERRSGPALKLRFPFEQESDGKIRYINDKATVVPTDPVVFGSSNTVASQESIAILERDQTFEITVPIAKLAIRLPMPNFKREMPAIVGGATANPRYFMFYDQARGIRLSGWFESASRFTGVKDPQPAFLAGKTLTHKNVAFKKIGTWDTVEYDVIHESINMASVNAHLVQAGTWIELHLSANSGLPISEQRDLLDKVLRSIQIFEKR